MKVLFIGPYGDGSTSKMRGIYLNKILKPSEYKVIDTEIPQRGLNRWFLSIGWRFKRGPMIRIINKFIEDELNGVYNYDMVWVEKGVFVLPAVLSELRKYSKKLVHFTPDPAFTYHRSDLFFNSIHLYDVCITTKSFELDFYKSYGVQTLLTTQGFDPALHKPLHKLEDKAGIVFIGHREKNREELLSAIVEAGLNLTLAGINWNRFVYKYRGYPNLDYRGTGLYGADYAQALSKAQFGLGLLSKWIPETHTTRTFEIPACKTILVTEKNLELVSIFNPSEVLFYNNVDDLITQINELQSNTSHLYKVMESGFEKVHSGEYDYENIILGILTKLKLVEASFE